MIPAFTGGKPVSLPVYNRPLNSVPAQSILNRGNTDAFTHALHFAGVQEELQAERAKANKIAHERRMDELKTLLPEIEEMTRSNPENDRTIRAMDILRLVAETSVATSYQIDTSLDPQKRSIAILEKKQAIEKQLAQQRKAGNIWSTLFNKPKKEMATGDIWKTWYHPSDMPFVGELGDNLVQRGLITVSPKNNGLYLTEKGKQLMDYRNSLQESASRAESGEANEGKQATDKSKEELITL